MDNSARIGIGGCGLTVAFTFLALTVPAMPLAVSGIGIVIGLCIVAWGFWPLAHKAFWQPETKTTEPKGDTQSVSDQRPLNHAVYLIAQRSAWRRWFAAQYLAKDNHIPPSERNIMHIATYMMTEAAMKGCIEIKGRKIGEIQFYPIHQMRGS